MLSWPPFKSPLRTAYEDKISRKRTPSVETLKQLEANYLSYITHFTDLATSSPTYVFLIRHLSNPLFVKTIYTGNRSESPAIAQAFTDLIEEMYELTTSLVPNKNWLPPEATVFSDEEKLDTSLFQASDDENICAPIIKEVILSSLRLAISIMETSSDSSQKIRSLNWLKDAIFSARDYFHAVTQTPEVALANNNYSFYFGHDAIFDYEMITADIADVFAKNRQRLYLRQFAGALAMLAGTGLMIAACFTPALPMVALLCMIYGGPLLIMLGAKLLHGVSEKDKQLNAKAITQEPFKQLDSLNNCLFNIMNNKRPPDSDDDIDEQTTSPLKRNICTA